MAVTLEDIKKLESTNTLKSWRETINKIREFLATLATKNHASESTEFGGATNKLYGHVILLDNEDKEYSSDKSYAVTPRALYDLKMASILKGFELNTSNIQSIDGALINGNIDLGSNISFPDDMSGSYIRAKNFIGTITNASRAVQAERDSLDREFHTNYVLIKDLIDRDGADTKLESIFASDSYKHSFLYQNNCNGYMPAINLATVDGRVIFGTDKNSGFISYVTKETDGDTTKINESSIKITSTGVEVSGTLTTNDTELNKLFVRSTCEIVGDTTLKDNCKLDGNLFINSTNNSVVFENTGSEFKMMIANTVNGVPNNEYVPLRFDLSTKAKNEYTGNTVSGKMTIGGDLHTKGTISADGKVYNAVWNDYAEFFPRGEETEVGDIVALDLSSDEERYVKASKTNPAVVGVHSDTYGHILGGEGSIEESEKTHIPVGLVGRVKTKIVGKIKKGEFVVLSGIAGVGCAYDAETNNPLDVIGVAVEASNDIGIKLVKIKLK